jgi:hypothetical protein
VKQSQDRAFKAEGCHLRFDRVAIEMKTRVRCLTGSPPPKAST